VKIEKRERGDKPPNVYLLLFGDARSGLIRSIMKGRKKYKKSKIQVSDQVGTTESSDKKKKFEERGRFRHGK